MDAKLILRNTYDDGGSYKDCRSQGDYLFAACYADGVRQYRKSNNSLSLVDTKDDGGNAVDVYPCGNYVFVASSSYVHAYAWSTSGLTLKDSIPYGGSVFYGVCAINDGAVVFVAQASGGIAKYAFDGNSFSGPSATVGAGEKYRDLWASPGNIIFAADGEYGLKVYDDSLSLITSNAGTFYDGIWGYYNNGRIKLACACLQEGLRIYDYYSSQLTLLAERGGGATWENASINSDYAAIAEGSALYLCELKSGAYELSSGFSDGSGNGVDISGQKIYVAANDDGLKVCSLIPLRHYNVLRKLMPKIG